VHAASNHLSARAFECMLPFLVENVGFGFFDMTWSECVCIFQRWHDVMLHWNPEDYGGVKTVRVPPSGIWLPDVLLYNQ